MTTYHYTFCVRYTLRGVTKWWDATRYINGHMAGSARGQTRDEARDKLRELVDAERRPAGLRID